MAYWLVKTEPNTWSWDDQVHDKTTFWNGVRNYQASNNMKAMKKGDECLFYHSGEERQIVGIVEVAKEYYPDPSDKEGRFGMVDLKVGRAFKTPVTLADVKADERLRDLTLVRNSRLSVQPVDAKSWKILCGMGGVKP
jgi:predicted RNA-binding protein with PUA-like domain